MDGSHSGFHVDDGAYSRYAREVDPLGEDVKGAAEKHVGPHVTLGGHGFSEMGGESGFSGAYSGRMRALREKLHRVGGGWSQVGDAARQTDRNYTAVEAEHGDVVRRLGVDLGQDRT